jgi:hypothetical protein
MTMKTSLLVLVAAGWTGFAALAGPLPIAQVDANAQWLLHLDLDAFRASQVGAKIARDRIEEPMARAAAEIKQKLGVDFDWKRIHGVTAYGLAAARPGQDRGVLLLDTDLDVRAGLDAAIAKQPEGNLGRLRLIEAGDHPVYWVKDESYIALIASGPVIAGKFEDDVRRARDVVLGSVPNLAARDPFGGYPAPGPGLVFYGATQGLAEGMPVPPKAEILKQADGLRLLVSETGGNLSLSLAMKTKTPEVAQQVRQVVQGLLALAALGQAGNPEVLEILAGLRVEGSERLVAVELAYPVTKALQKMDEKGGARWGW